MSEALEVQERQKYDRMWKDDKYRAHSDGVPIVTYAHHVMQCEGGATLIDWGCGAGRAATAFTDLGLKVTGFDISPNCLDSWAGIPLVIGTLWDPPSGLEADYGFCCDVLEHMPRDKVDLALNVLVSRTRIAAYCQSALNFDP